MTAGVTAAVSSLYRAAGVRPPTTTDCVAPLGALIAGLRLDCIELPQLTVRAVADYLSQYGIAVEIRADIERTKLAGYLHVSTSIGFIFVDQLDRVTRRRFSVAHELGHYVLHFRPMLDELRRRGEPLTLSTSDSHDTSSAASDSDKQPDQGARGFITASDEAVIAGLLPPEERMEDEADSFASELLMPSDVVRESARQHDLPADDLAWRLATEMLVSRSSMNIRLKELGFI